jgi:hypothetical protein
VTAQPAGLNAGARQLTGNRENLAAGGLGAVRTWPYAREIFSTARVTDFTRPHWIRPPRPPQSAQRSRDTGLPATRRRDSQARGGFTREAPSAQREGVRPTLSAPPGFASGADAPTWQAGRHNAAANSTAKLARFRGWDAEHDSAEDSTILA